MIRNWIERRLRDKENSGHIYIEFDSFGKIRTMNNESLREVTVSDDGTITIIMGLINDKDHRLELKYEISNP